MTDLYEFRFTCNRCKKIFDGHSTVKPLLNNMQEQDTLVRGFLCYQCAHQEDLQELGF